MAPPDKVTPEQKEFLFKLMSEFLEQQKKGKLHKFWVMLYGEWFRQWEIVEDLTIEDMTERKEALGAEIKAKKSYLRRWFQNHSRPKRVVPFGRLVKQAQKDQKAKRRPQLTEVYCWLFYKDRVRHHVKAEVERLTILNGKKPTRGMKLRLVRNYAIALLELEHPEIKDKVEAEYERHKEEVEEIQKEATSTPQAAIETIGAHFNAFSKIMGDLTGWKFTLLAGGPDPTNGGRIRTAAVHYGENHAGLSFGEAMPDARRAAGAAFGSFLHSVYTPAECAARSIYPEDAVQGVASMPPSNHRADMPAAPAVHLPPPLPIGDTNLLAALQPLSATPDEPILEPSLGPAGQGLNDFDPLDDNIDWDSLRLFDPRVLQELGPGMLGGGPGLSLTEELAAPLPNDVLHGFGMLGNNVAVSGQAASLVDSIVAQPTTIQNSPVTPLSGSYPLSEPPLTCDGPPAADGTPAAADGTPAAADGTPAAADGTPAAADGTPAAADGTPAAADGTPAAADGTPAAADGTPAAADGTPAAADGTPAAADGTPAADSTTNSDTATTNTTAASVTGPPAADDAANSDTATTNTVATGVTAPPAVDGATNSDAAGTASVTGSQSNADVTNARPRIKRTRDPIDVALIVPGKRCRKAKERADTEVDLSKPKGKENRPPASRR
ncbi:hypothetical protein EYR38_009869 [Pleurotus pulmonarius]|nr:hypothetical protein EYR38_009869 [Pleurotus pulmonarius]